ncbi:extracellular calcium-sensing receptor-like [Protopterus annectens]|uniref:extracellular calcium-sensing receptor-like n=1 Tax=Protopterus annectens TaxID=7888 RepID=UPI001CFB855C|nr:extracellular calcium-sensing receptor-like [Protopterus annectens]
MKQNIFKGQCIRAARMTSNAQDMQDEIKYITNLFKERNYPSTILDNIGKHVSSEWGLKYKPLLGSDFLFYLSFNLRSYRWVQGMRFAINEINRSLTLLPNVTLGFMIYDTCLDIARTLHGTLWMISGQHIPIPNYRCQHHSSLAAIIGDSQSSCSIPMAHLLGLYFQPQISYFASSPVLNDRKQYPSFFRTIPSDEFQAQGLAELLSYFSWTWVGILAEDTNYGQVGAQILKEAIVKDGGCVAFHEMVPIFFSQQKISNIVNVIKSSSAVAIVVFSGDPFLIQLMKELFRQSITGRVWIASEAWSSSPNLSKLNLVEVLHGTLGFAVQRGNIRGFRDAILMTDPSMYSDDIFIKAFWEESFGCRWPDPVSELVDNTTKPCTGTERLETLRNAYTDVSNLRITYNIYNAVYAVAHMLHDLSKCNPEEGPFYNRTCVNIHGYHPWQLLHYMKNVHFVNNANIEIYFDEHGNIPAQYDILNWHMIPNGTTIFVELGKFSITAAQEHKLIINSSAIQWTRGHTQVPRSVCSENCPLGHRKATKQGQPECCFDCVPCSQGEFTNQTESAECKKCPDDHWTNAKRDRCLPKTTDFLSYHDPLGGTIAFVSIFFSLLPAAVLIIFIKYRDTPIIKANNQELSCVLLTGLVLCFLCSLIFIGQPVSITCVLRQTTFGVIFTLCVSCVLAKTVMVVIAFRATNPNHNLKKYMGPNLPKVIVILFTFLQVIICVTWVTSTPPTVEYDMKSHDRKVIIQCNEGSSTAFWCMLGYMGLLATVSLFVAFLARKLPDSFNEAKYITFSMVVFISVWLSFTPAYLSTKGKYMVAVEIFAILSSSAGLLACIFFPKCYIILLRPQRNIRRELKGKK